jgi:hypothetical protein
MRRGNVVGRSGGRRGRGQVQDCTGQPVAGQWQCDSPLKRKLLRVLGEVVLIGCRVRRR